MLRTAAWNPNVMEMVLEALKKETGQDDSRINDLASALRQAMLYDPWRLRYAMAGGEEDLVAALGPKLFNLENAFERLSARGFFITLNVCVSAWCREHATEEPLRHIAAAATVREPPTPTPTSANGDVPERKKARRREPDQRLAGIVPKKVASEIKELPLHLLESAKILKQKAEDREGKLTAFEMRDWMDSLRNYCIEQGVFGHEHTNGCLKKVTTHSPL